MQFWQGLSKAPRDAAHGDRAVVLKGRQSISESAFRARVASWREVFERTATRDIALHEPDGFEFACALIGAWYASKTVYLPGDAQPETCRALAERGTVFAGSFPREFGPIAKPLVNSIASAAAAPFAPLDTSVVNTIIFTSGSTGVPQAVPKRLAQLLSEVETLETQFGDRMHADDVVVATVSHQHIYGLLFKILWPLHSARTFESESILYPEQLAEYLTARSAIVVSGPAHLKRLPETLNWYGAQRNVRAVFSSGGPLSLEAVTLAERTLGPTPIEVYGSSETGGIAWRQRTSGVDAGWRALPTVDVRADDGQLAVRSAHLPTSDWLIVEDFAEFQDDGRFVLKGRSDRLAKIEGKRVSLVAMENVLLNTGLASEVRLVQLESARDEVGAIVVPAHDGWTEMRENGSQALRQKLNAALHGAVERIAHPRRWRWVDALPVNAVGKTTNAACVALFSQGGLNLPAINVLTSSTTEVQAELYVSPHLPVFDGHFRDTPVLPGVAQLDWAMCFGRRHFAMTGSVRRLEAVKFQRVYQPGALLSLHMRWNADRRMMTFSFESLSAGITAQHSSGRIFLGD